MEYKTVVLEIVFKNNPIKTLIYLKENEYEDLKKKSSRNKSSIENVFIRDYIEKIIDNKSNILSIKDYSSVKTERYVLINKDNIDELSIELCAILDGKQDKISEILYNIE